MMKRKLGILSLLLIVVLGVIACTTGTSGDMLEDTRWVLESYGEQNNLVTILEDTEITSTFEKDEGKVSGSSGCNTYFAQYEVKNNILSITGIASTEMACTSPEGVMEQEQEFLSLLAKAQSFQADDTTLTIICLDGRQLYFTITSK